MTGGRATGRPWARAYTGAARDWLTLRAVQLYTGDRMNLRAVGERLHVSHSTVRTLLSEAGVTVRPVGVPPRGDHPLVSVTMCVPPHHADAITEYARNRRISVAAAAAECVARSLGLDD